MKHASNVAVKTAKGAPGEYWDSRLQCYLKTVQPGEFAVTGRSDLAIGTLLGSCVSACICDPKAAIGGLNHFLLPQDNANTGNSTGAATRYGVHAMEMLINQILKCGGVKNRLQAKLFGGANVIAMSAAQSIGERNREFALDFLKREGIPVLATDFGGSTSRRVYFFPASNKVLVGVPNQSETAKVLREEIDLGHRASPSSEFGDVDLF